MGIINQHRKENTRGIYKEPVKEVVDSKSAKILDLTYMKKLIGDVLSYHKTKEPKKTVNNFRKWTYVQQWRLQNLLGYVDTPTFVFMLESVVEWCIDVRGSVQPNGKWELFDFEIQLEQKETVRNQSVGKDQNGNVQTEQIVEPVQYLVIGLQFVDTNGNEDLQYEMGRPKANSDQAITPKMLREILANQGSKINDAVPVQVDKYKDVIEKQQTRIAQQDASMLEMKEQMTQMQEMVAGLITELQTAKNSDIVEETPKPVKKTPVKKRSK